MSFTVYRSSAGSGKTFTLVKEYLKIALTDTQDPPKLFRRILAITFTNKAAAEMKDRIIRALKDLSSDDHSAIPSGSRTLLDTLIRETGFSPDVLRERAGSVLKAILHNYSDFAIGTIDSFVHKVVRSFAFDLRLPANFEIELDAGKLLGEAVQILISKIGEDEALTQALIEFTESKAQEERSWHIEEDLNILARELLQEEGARHIEKLKGLKIPDFISIRKKMQGALRTFEASVSAKASEAFGLIQSRQLSHGVFFYKDKGIGRYFEKLSQSKNNEFSPNSYVVKTIEEDKWTSKDASPSDIAAIDSIKGRLSELYHGIQEDIQKNLPAYRLYQLLSRNMYALAVLNEIEKVLDEYKNENAILHISEFNKLIAEIVFNEPVPFIYERLGERYSNYLIDEFQDTSILQWQNLLPLIDNALSEEQFTMIVGDGKQAIYRWRGGDVSQFADLPLIREYQENPVIREREASLKRHYLPQYLGSNYRSKTEIIAFNNDLYTKLSGTLPDDYRRIYEQLAQKGNPLNTGGCVSLEFYGGDKTERQLAHQSRVLELTQSLRNEGYAFSDIAILTRTNREGNAMASFLIRQGIAVLSNDSLLLRNSALVNFLSAALDSLHNPDNEIARAEIMLFLSRKENSPSLQADLAVAKSPAAFHRWMKEKEYPFFPNQLLKLPLYQLCEELLRIFGLENSPDPYLIFFLDEILAFSNGRDSSLAGWLIHWEDKKDKVSATVPEGMDAVHILTVHRSKGLEYPVVILPFNDSNPKPGKDSFWLSLDDPLIPEFPSGMVSNNKALKDTAFSDVYTEEQYRTQLDNLNLLYVATTRPEERLYILASSWKDDAKPGGDFSEMLAWYLHEAGQRPDEKGRLMMGTALPRTASPKELQKESVGLSDFISAGWQDRIRIRSAAREAWSEEQLKKQDTGVLIHTVLSRIQTAEDMEAALFSVHAEGLINSEQMDEIRILLLALMNHETLKPLFAKGVRARNEAEILVAKGGAFRPDRIIYAGDRTVILDYKTGKETPSHHEQVENYASILKEMGEKNVEKYLVYTDEMNVVKV
jgi:ATP-dependent exoDNAse (exonuclease V) beta subunit